MDASDCSCGISASAAWCGCTPTVAQTLGCAAAIAVTTGAWARVTPMLTISPTPAAAARARRSGSSAAVK